MRALAIAFPRLTWSGCPSLFLLVVLPILSESRLFHFWNRTFVQLPLKKCLTSVRGNKTINQAFG
jgi:hypothetical protein